MSGEIHQGPRELACCSVCLEDHWGDRLVQSCVGRVFFAALVQEFFVTCLFLFLACCRCVEWLLAVRRAGDLGVDQAVFVVLVRHCNVGEPLHSDPARPSGGSVSGERFLQPVCA